MFTSHPPHCRPVLKAAASATPYTTARVKVHELEAALVNEPPAQS